MMARKLEIKMEIEKKHRYTKQATIAITPEQELQVFKLCKLYECNKNQLFRALLDEKIKADRHALRGDNDN